MTLTGMDRVFASTSGFEWMPVDGGVNRACRGKSAGDNLASYFTVQQGLADLSACQQLCESTEGCKGVEYHSSGRCEIWTREGGIEASIGLDGYSCYSYEISDFIEVGAGIDRACRGETVEDDSSSHKTVQTVTSLSQCKQLCRNTATCTGIEFSGSRCEVWSHDIKASIAAPGVLCMKLEFAKIDGDNRACRGSSTSDNNPQNYIIASGAASEAECKDACRMQDGCGGIEYSRGRCELWIRPEGIEATVPLSGFKCLRYNGADSQITPTTTSTTLGTTTDASRAQFLIRSTFGPTLSSMSELANKTYQAWIDEQMLLPAGLHRAFWRQRVNPHVLPEDVGNGNLIGNARSRCENGSRWVGYTFLTRDVGRPVKVIGNQILVDGVHRADVDLAYTGNGMDPPQTCNNNPPEHWQTRGLTCESEAESMAWNCYDDFWKEEKLCQKTCFDRGHGYNGDDCSGGWAGVEFDGYVCRVKANSVGAWVQLGTAEDCTEGLRAMTNPRVWRSTASAEMTQSLSFRAFRPDVILMSKSVDPCNLGTVIQSDVEGDLRFYMLEARLNLVENTLERPASADSWIGGVCPAVSRTFVNWNSCKLLPGCLPLGVESVQLTLNAATFQRFFTVGGRYVYAITGLRTSTSPCGGRSRWKRLNCQEESCSTTTLPASDADAIRAQLLAEASQGWLRDTTIECNSITAGAVVQVDSDYFQHVHKDEFNVYDFTDWVAAHPGGPDKITQWTSQGYQLAFPSWHDMLRWDAGSGHRTLQPNLVGRYNETVLLQTLPQPLQTQALVEDLSGSGIQGEVSLVCGSPGEVANDPEKGHQLSITHGGDYDWHFDMDYLSRWGTDRLAKTAVWTMKALYGKDQFRQRMAWALSQIFVVAIVGDNYAGQNEMWMNFYDIFVRHAFGNFRDVLREVTYNPIMGDYLTFKRNRAFDESNNYPDENFAREIMQLFTIGLWKLNEDGTRVQESGRDVPTYSNEHIMNFARVFTGFDEQPDRDNIEWVWNQNFIDPMRIQARWHDVYPKPDLDGGYLGDRYPICADLPAGYFLNRGARYEFLGHSYSGTDVLNLTMPSALLMHLCGSGGSPCNYRPSIELSQDLECSNQECTVDTVFVVNVAGGYYEYVPPVCTNLFFFNGQVTRRGGRAWGWTSQCQDPKTPVAGSACCGGCKNRKDWWWLDWKKCSCDNATDACPELFTEKCKHDELWAEHKWCRLACWENSAGYDGDDCSKGLWRGERLCGYPMERVRMATAERQCADRGLELCWERLEGYECDYDEVPVWTPEACSYEVIVHADGTVSSNLTSRTRQNRFSVDWKTGYPGEMSGSCPAGCRLAAAACSCSFVVEDRAVFAQIPAASQLHRLKIGSVRPSGQCTDSCSGPILVYAAGGTGQIDAETVFEFEGKFYKNKEVFVVVGDKAGGFEFRNPPSFVTLENPRERDAHAEVDSLLDHLFYHNNTAPFIAYRLIQRFGVSNPSPAYVQAVAQAFKTGQYNGRVYSGAYGDLGATAAAVLLFPEAVSVGATTGSLREPLLKVIHFMRSMEYKDRVGRNVLLENLMPLIGQFPYRSPSVFNYFLPSFKPADFPPGMVGPEFQIFTPPMAISFTNGLTSLIELGLGPCSGGFGFNAPQNCSNGQLHLGELECLQPTIDQLDLLLTGGRLNDSAMIRSAWKDAEGGQEYKAAQMAVVMTPEFHTLGDPLPVGPRTPEPPRVTSEARSYKALVMVFLHGGADTFNMLVPMNCPLYDEYQEVRGSVALSPSELNQIATEGQTCADFGIHARLPLLKELYDLGEAAFISNVGSLAAPVSKVQWESGAGERCAGLFSHSDQQQAAQTLTCQSAASASKGAGGRIADALGAGSQKYRTMSFSVAGMSTWSQGMDTAAEIIDQRSGAVKFENYERLKTVIDNITSVQHGNIYAEEYVRKFSAAINFNEELGEQLKTAKLKTSYPTNEVSLSRQLKQVARLIAARDERRAERDVFYVEIGGWDTHSSVSQELNNRFGELNTALETFVSEMKAQGIFDSTTLLTHSDFARTLTPNSGDGTDHGWAGNHVIIGGAVKGGRVYNDFPSSYQEGSNQDAGRGRLIPKYPWENMMMPVAEWMGVEDSQLSNVFPNIAAFNSSLLMTGSRLFVAS